MIDLSRVGAVDQPDGEGRAGGGRCNDRVRFTVGLVGDRLDQVRFGADACVSTTAAAAWLAARAEGGALLAGARLGLAEVLAGAEIDPAGAECALTAVDAFHATSNRSAETGNGTYAQSSPISRNAAFCIRGERECATGSPITPSSRVVP